MSLSRRCGSAEADIDSAFAHPGRIASGVTVRASKHGRVHRLRGRPQHRGGHRPGGDIDHPGRLHASFNPGVHTWSTVGLYDTRDGRIAVCWLLPLDATEFDAIWSG